ncbi:hypothetical protein AB0C93_35200 [Streptomyces sp. NPDC048518]|uniref:hypothetical protein n=1 Tax=Streptomyces sp. NPDC048518 TaxID=3155029 RepID=UPI0033C47B40
MNVNEKKKSEPPTWQLSLGRQGLRVDAGRHLRLSMSLTLIGWLASTGGFVGAISHWHLML